MILGWLRFKKKKWIWSKYACLSVPVLRKRIPWICLQARAVLRVCESEGEPSMLFVGLNPKAIPRLWTTFAISVPWVWVDEIFYVMCFSVWERVAFLGSCAGCASERHVVKAGFHEGTFHCESELNELLLSFEVRCLLTGFSFFLNSLGIGAFKCQGWLVPEWFDSSQLLVGPLCIQQNFAAALNRVQQC